MQLKPEFTHAGHSAAAIALLEESDDLTPVITPEVLTDDHSPALTHPSHANSPGQPPAQAKTVNLDLVARLKGLVETGYKGKLWSRNELSRAIGTNQANISLYLRQDAISPPPFSFAVAPMEAKIRDFLTTLASKRELDKGIIATSVVTRFSTFVDTVRAVGEVGFYYGAAGLGKSTAIESYTAANGNAYAVAATKWSCSASAMVDQLFTALKLTSVRGVSKAVAIAAKLKDLQAVILVDNAHRLTFGGVEYWFDLYDLTGTPIVFAGNRRFLDRLRNDDQLFSRLFYKTEAAFVDGPDKAKNSAIHSAADAILKRELPAHVSELRTMARRVAREPGHLRALVKRCRAAAEFATLPAYQDRPITDAFLAAHAASVNTGYSLEEE